MVDNPAAAAHERAVVQRRILDDLDEVSNRVQAGDHSATRRVWAAQCDALRYLVDVVGQVPDPVIAFKAPAPDPDLRDGLLRRLQDGFYRHAQDQPAATVTGPHGEQVDVSTVADVHRKAARLADDSDYRCGVTDALEWILGRLSHIEISSIDNSVVKIQGWLEN